MYLSVVKASIFYFLIFISGSLYGQESFQLPLMDIPIEVIHFGQDTADVLLYNMHDNENTSALAGRVFGEKYAGSYYELLHTGKRNISFLIGDDSIHIDPNRIYTDTGIRLQLEKNEIKDTLLFQAIRQWRDTLLTKLRIDSRSLVIALHNNTANNYSFKSYQPGKEYEAEACALKKGCYYDKDDFYFVTDSIHFEQLANGNYNVILQATETLTDDGSLSVYCGQFGIPYVNVEAQHGHFSRQLKMLIYAYWQLVEDPDATDNNKINLQKKKRKLLRLFKASKT